MKPWFAKWKTWKILHQSGGTMNIWWCKAKHLSFAYKKSLTFSLTVVIVTVKSSSSKQTSRTCRLSVLGDIHSCPVSERLFICVCGTLLWLSLTEPCRDRVSQHASLRGTGVVWQLWRETENWDPQLRDSTWAFFTIKHNLSSLLCTTTSLLLVSVRSCSAHRSALLHHDFLSVQLEKQNCLIDDRLK